VSPLPPLGALGGYFLLFSKPHLTYMASHTLTPSYRCSKKLRSNSAQQPWERQVEKVPMLTMEKKALHPKEMDSTLEILLGQFVYLIPLSLEESYGLV
jgi:hypothetical protein